MVVNVTGNLKTFAKLILLALLVPLLNACTPANPVFGFDFSSEKLTSNLVIQTDVPALNVSNSAKVVISGSCNEKAKIKLISPVAKDLECAANNYQQSLDLVALPDGEVLFQIESKDIFGDMVVVEHKLVKDMSAPLLTMAQPSDIGSGVNNISLNGTCSEEGIDVIIDESSTGKQQKTKCNSSQWSMSFDLGSDLGINQFFFKAQHIDTGLNEVVVNSAAVNRVVIGDFSISGVSHISSGPYTSLLKGYFNNFYISWTPAVNVVSFEISIYEFNNTTNEYDIEKCHVSGIAGNLSSKQMTGCNLVAGMNHKVKMIAQNALRQSVNRDLNFATKNRPKWKLDSKKLYIGSSFETAAATHILFSDFIEDYDTDVAPYTITANSIDAPLNSILFINQGDQKITISPGTTRISGKFSASFVIVDSLGNTSDSEAVNYHLVMPFSWAGLIDNDFNKPGNWCGPFTLKDGCQGNNVAPSFSAKVMIDNLCLSPTTVTVSTYCEPALSANAQAHTFFIKSNSFSQNGFDLTVGDVGGASSGEFARNLSFFRQSGGAFNSTLASGQLTVTKYFEVTGGLFYAPKNSDFFLNAKDTTGGYDLAYISNKNYFIHNGSNLKIVDPLGSSGVSPVNLTFAENTELYHLTFDSDAGRWLVKSNNLIVNGDLNLGGRIRAGEYPHVLHYDSNSKITLRGNVICSGTFKGGSLPILIDTGIAATYKVTSNDCKLPPVYLAASGSFFTEHASSSFDLRMEGLKILSGNIFRAPAAPRKLKFMSELLSSGAYTLYNYGGVFDHNNSEVEFYNLGDGSKEYKIMNLSSTLNVVKFINNSLGGDFFKLQSNLIVNDLYFEGTHSVNLRGDLNTITADNLSFNKGLTADALVLNKIILSAAGGPFISVNTSDRINLPNLVLNRDISFSGTSFIFDLSGANFDIQTYNFTVPSGYDFYYNILNASTGFITSNGTATASSL